jgi:hypothetical protein
MFCAAPVMPLTKTQKVEQDRLTLALPKSERVKPRKITVGD